MNIVGLYSDRNLIQVGCDLLHMNVGICMCVCHASLTVHVL